MQHQILISAETLDRLKACAEPFVDTNPEDVIRRLLNEREKTAVNRQSQVPSNSGHSPTSRVPRERGAVVEVGGKRFQASSVRDLYEQVLRFLVDKHGSELKQILPFRTSRERFLVAEKPIHPNENEFFVPVKYRGHYIEAHKDYKNAISHLESLVKKLRLEFKYFG